MVTGTAKRPRTTRKTASATERANRIEAQAVAAVGKQKTSANANIAAANLGAVQTLPQFLATTGQLTLAERERIVIQALVLIDDLFVHLPLKQAMHAINPVQRLRLLRARLSNLSERQFHNEMIDIFVRLRDLHTNYILPAPYNQHTAFLPFLLEEFHDAGGTRHYIVSRLIAGFTHPTFVPGVEVVSWNGIPIDRAVEINADREAGSNEDARHVRGLDRTTVRPMMMSLPPDEAWVVVGYRDETADREIRLDWNVFAPDPSPSGAVTDDPDDPVALAAGLDLLTEATNRAKKILFAPKAMERERRFAKLARGGLVTEEKLGAEAADTSLLPDVFTDFGTVNTASGPFGYVRIRTFNSPPDLFIPEFIRILGLLPQTGLIIDVRGNGGGIILSGERMLQLLTPRWIEAERLHFINTPLTERVAGAHFSLDPWRRSIEQSLRTGAVYSRGFPIEPEEETNALGQHYVGPVVLITDARCYSTTDIFAAGFQDHEIGTILGVDGNTGAGGANVWDHALLQAVLPGPNSPIQPLPKGADMRVAIRRTTRVGRYSGQPVEDLGIVPDERHFMTRNDLLNGNIDLIERAGEILASQTLRVLDGQAQRTSPNQVSATLSTGNLTRVDIYAEGRPLRAVDVSDGSTTVSPPLTAPGVDSLDLHGFDDQELVAIRRIAVA